MSTYGKMPKSIIDLADELEQLGGESKSRIARTEAYIRLGIGEEDSAEEKVDVGPAVCIQGKNVALLRPSPSKQSRGDDDTKALHKQRHTFACSGAFDETTGQPSNDLLEKVVPDLVAWVRSGYNLNVLDCAVAGVNRRKLHGVFGCEAMFLRLLDCWLNCREAPTFGVSFFAFAGDGKVDLLLRSAELSARPSDNPVLVQFTSSETLQALMQKAAEELEQLRSDTEMTVPLVARLVQLKDQNVPANSAHFFSIPHITPATYEQETRTATKPPMQELEQLIREMSSATETPRRLRSSSGSLFINFLAELSTSNAKTVLVGSILQGIQHFDSNLQLLKLLSRARSIQVGCLPSSNLTAKELIHRKPEEVLLTNIQTHISSTTKPNLLPDLLSSPTTINVDAIEDYIADLALDVIERRRKREEEIRELERVDPKGPLDLQAVYDEMATLRRGEERERKGLEQKLQEAVARLSGERRRLEEDVRSTEQKLESLPESLSMTLFDTFETYREILVAQVEEDRELANRLQKPFVSFEQNLTALRLYMTNIRKKVQQMQSKQKQWSQQEDQRQLHLRRKDEVATKLSNMQEHSASNLAQLTTLREEEQTFRAAVQKATERLQALEAKREQLLGREKSCSAQIASLRELVSGFPSTSTMDMLFPIEVDTSQVDDLVHSLKGTTKDHTLIQHVLAVESDVELLVEELRHSKRRTVVHTCLEPMASSKQRQSVSTTGGANFGYKPTMVDENA